MSCTPCQTAKPALSKQIYSAVTLLPWRVGTHASCTGAWGPRMYEKLNGSKFFCQNQSKHPWKQEKAESYCEVPWLLCGSSARGVQKLPSDAESLKCLQMLNSSLCHSQTQSQQGKMGLGFVCVELQDCTYWL